jgi:hypothetical protein
MKSYSEFVDRVLRTEHLLGKLTPTEPLDWELPKTIREASNPTLAGSADIDLPTTFSLIRGGLLYAVDALDASHKVFQDVTTSLGSYWHGMMHRREGDFDNARYWYRRAGVLPFFAELHGQAANLSSDMARQENWDPYLLSGQCEQAVHGAEELAAEMVKLQVLEFEILFDYCWRQSGIHKR